MVVGSVGLDLDVFDACMQSRKFVSKIQSDLSDGVRFGVNATPTFFVNGKRIVGGENLLKEVNNL